MKTKISILIALILLTGILYACKASANTITINEQDAGKTIELKAGDTIVVSLDGNLTTGFSWIPAVQDPILLEQVGDVEVTPASDAIGSPGRIVLKFNAIAKGQTDLHLEYKRGWEEGVPPEKTFDVRVVVK